MSNAMTYDVRAGTTNYAGWKYEYKMAALFALKFAFKNGEMRMAFNAPDVGAFDDIVIHHAGDTYLLQLKHKENGMEILKKDLLNDNGDFALKKYFNHVAELKRNLTSNSKTQFQKTLGKFKVVHFILFTNRSIGQYKYLEEIVKTKVNFLNCKPDGKVHRINANNLPFPVDDPNNYSKVFVISNQMHEKYLDSLILQKIKNVLKCYQLTDDDIAKVAETFTNFIQNWGEGYAKGDFHHWLTKIEICQKLSEIMLRKYEATFIDKPFEPCIRPNQQIWNNIVKSKKFTVIKYSEDVFDFLLKYIADEVNKHCALGNTVSWSEDLPDTLRNVFYQNYGDLKTQMIKITKYLDTLKPVDIYKCLWTITKIPVLLEVATSRHLDDVQQILQMSNSYYKVLILNKCEESYTSEYVWKTPKISTFFSLEDVNETDRDSILRMNVSLQGRGPIGLGSLITENMFRYITCENIISTLTDNFNIESKPTPLTDYFVERKVSRIFITSQALDEVEHDQFVIGGNWEEDVNATLIAKNECKRRTDDAFSAQNRIKIGSKMDSIGKQIDKPRSPSIHHLVEYSENLFEWKCSIGSVSSIKPFVVELENVTESDIVSKVSSKVTLLSGAPGMGKSVLLDYLAHMIPASRWVIKVDLNAHMDYLREFKEESSMNEMTDHLKYFHDFYASQGNKNLSDAIFNKLRSSRNIVVMLDGFDEISLQYKEEVVDIAISLCNEGCRVYITTRPHMQEYLEDTLGTFSIELKSFSENDQIDFLRKYFSGTSNLDLESQQCISHFVENLLQATKSNLVDLDAEFTGIPLQTKLLAEAFQDDCRRILFEKNPNDFNQIFDLISLYQSFINKKMEILASKNGYSKEKAHSLLHTPQAVLALKLLFPSHCDVIEYIEEQPGYSRLDRELLQEGGIVTIDKRSNINFIHRTFGEYLAAQWLSENFNSEDEKIKNIAKILIEQRFDQNHKFLFILFDRILAAGCPLLLDIINENMTRAIDTLSMNNIETILVTDRCKRSVLHMLALYGPPSLAEKALDIVADTLKHHTAPYLDQLGYSPLDYALVTGCLGIANILCNFWKQLPLQVHIRREVIIDYLYTCAMQNRIRLFKLLTVYFQYRNLLFNNANMDEKIEHYYQRAICMIFIYKNFPDFKNKTIRQFVFEEGSQIIPSLQNLDTDIHMATIFGSKEKASCLIQHSHDINKGDSIFNNTVLHYAILHNKTDLIEQILEREVDVNRSNINKDTPLHLAVQQSTKTILKKIEVFKTVIHIKHKKIVKMLLSKGAQINVQNNNGNTPLHLALVNRNQHIAMLLISKGADVSITNKFGESCLHFAVRYGSENNNLSNVKMLLSKGAPINVQDDEGDTPLHLALKNRNQHIATLLISKGADVGITNKVGESCLHFAARYGCENNHLSSVKMLLSKGAQINVQNNDGDTPLHLALENRNQHIATLLISKGADVGITNKIGASCLHVAAYFGCDDVLRHLLSLKMDVNSQTNSKETPLILAAGNDHLSSVKVLLSKGAQINVQNNYGDTPLHLALAKRNQHIATLLISKGADVGITKELGESCLHFAAEHGCDDVLRHLLSLKLDANGQTNDKETPLILAAVNNHLSSVKILLSYGAKVNTQNFNGSTCLHYAVLFGDKDMVNELILCLDIDINRRDALGYTPLDYTDMIVKHDDIARLLISRGASRSMQRMLDEP